MPFSPFVVTAVLSTSQPGYARPRKSLGQHFLADGRIAGRILDAALLAPEDVVVEIGPGRGALTRRLAPRVARVVAVELDRALADQLPERLGRPDNLTVLHEDARTVEPGVFEELGGDYKVVANLPYYAANPIVRRFLEFDCPPSLLVVMVQREVADAMTASPGRMSLLSVATQFYCEATRICAVPASSFRPAPKVSSAVVRLTRRPMVALDKASVDLFFDLVRAGFRAPRKQLRNSLCQALKMDPPWVSRVLEQAGVDGARRAETLTLEEWVTLYRVYSAESLAAGRNGVATC